jgi:hypothetical protein
MVGRVKDGSELDITSLPHLLASKTLMPPAHRNKDYRHHPESSNYSNDAIHKQAQVIGTISLIHTMKAYRGSRAIPPFSLNLDTFTSQPGHPLNRKLGTLTYIHYTS